MARKFKRNILITGAGGLLGKTLTAHLSKSGDALFLTARKKIDAPTTAKIYYGDLEDNKFCRRILKNIDTVYYTAGFKKNIAVHTAKPFESFSGNVLPLLTFLQAAKHSHIRKLMYVSSTIIEYASLEDSVIDGYVWGKYACEMAVRVFAKETDIEVKIVRSAPIYGAGDNFDLKTANFIPAFIQRVEEADGEVVIWGSGRRTLQFIYVDDLARNMIAATRSPKNFFVFGNNERISVNEIAKNIIKLSGRILAIRHDLSKPDKKTLLSTFNNLVEPKTNMIDGLKKTLQYYQSHHA